MRKVGKHRRLVERFEEMQQLGAWKHLGFCEKITKLCNNLSVGVIKRCEPDRERSGESGGQKRQRGNALFSNRCLADIQGDVRDQRDKRRGEEIQKQVFIRIAEKRERACPEQPPAPALSALLKPIKSALPEIERRHKDRQRLRILHAEAAVHGRKIVRAEEKKGEHSGRFAVAFPRREIEKQQRRHAVRNRNQADLRPPHADHAHHAIFDRGRNGAVIIIIPFI